MNENIANTLRQVSEKLSDQIGLIEACSGKQLTFGELESLSDGYATYLKSEGLSNNDRVMLMVKPSADFICLTFGLFKLGATIILIDPGMGYRNLLRCIEKVEPTAFIGIPKGCVFKSIFKKTFSTVKRTFCCGNSYLLYGSDIRKEVGKVIGTKFDVYLPNANDLAAIIFTTGSTGPPKGVQYNHSTFAAQLNHIRNYYKIGVGDIDQPAFPLFALFSTALGACAVIPDMDPTKPAQVNPVKFLKSLDKYKVTYSFGSPAIWNVISRYCIENQRKIPDLKKVLMAGAPVSGELIERVQATLEKDAKIYTPYGATESLPIVSMEGSEIVTETWGLTQQGKGTCVGRSLPGIEVTIIEPVDGPIKDISNIRKSGVDEIGEIIVKGDVVTRAYYNNSQETLSAKIYQGDEIWHRMGDMGYLDDIGRLWFCGRKAHRVITDHKIMYTIPCEALTNNHPQVFRSALVGVSFNATDKVQAPVMIIEKIKMAQMSDEQLINETIQICSENALTASIEYVLIHPGFPVDIRHNAKIFREKLAIWAENILVKKNA